MKKGLILLVFTLIGTLISCEESGSSETRARIIAEDFVKQEVLSPSDLEMNVTGVERTGIDEYHVVADIKTLNGLGLKVPRKVSIRLRYKGQGDWTDIANWEKHSVRFLNPATGKEE